MQKYEEVFFFLSDVPGCTEPMNNVVCICLVFNVCKPTWMFLTEAIRAAIKGVKH